MRVSRKSLAVAAVIILPLISVGILLIWLYAITPGGVPISWDETNGNFTNYDGEGNTVLLEVQAHGYSYWDSWDEWIAIMRMRRASGLAAFHRADLDFSFRCFPFIADMNSDPEGILEMLENSGLEEVQDYFEAQFRYCEQLIANEIERLEKPIVAGDLNDRTALVEYFTRSKNLFEE